jgi:hypothetical protein
VSVTAMDDRFVMEPEMNLLGDHITVRFWKIFNADHSRRPLPKDMTQTNKAQKNKDRSQTRFHRP